MNPADLKKWEAEDLFDMFANIILEAEDLAVQQKEIEKSNGKSN